LPDGKLDAIVFFEGFEALRVDFAVVDEKVLTAPLGNDESIALLVAEPFHGSGFTLFHDAA